VLNKVVSRLDRVVFVIVLVPVVILVGLWLGQRRLVYLPDRSPVPPAAQLFAGGIDVATKTSDGLTLGAWLVPPTRGDLGLVILMAPGNGGNRLGRAPLATALAAQGFAILLMEYRGYGGNPGRPTEAGLTLDARAALAYLLGSGWSRDRIIYFGESLGSAVVTRLAVEQPPAALLLRSPFTDLGAAGQHNYPFLPVRLMLWDRLPVADLIGRVRVPTVVVLGTSDSVVPPEQSIQVAAQAGGPVEVVRIEGADHNDPALFDGPRVIDAVLRLSQRVS
jgi:fermentation-respiration switch protein FrsA (DUF1100 family)